jgi:hypothetical protein
MYPQASPSGDEGELFDTGWDVHHAGPARIFLSETDIRDVLSSDDVLERTLIMELLEARGWMSPDAFKAQVADFAEALEQMAAERSEAIAEADGLKLSLARHVTGSGNGTVVATSGFGSPLANVGGGSAA